MAEKIAVRVETDEPADEELDRLRKAAGVEEGE